jgi:hypothetical protein
VAVVVEICELVGPLCHYAKRVFEECYDDEEATDSWEVSMDENISHILA